LIAHRLIRLHGRHLWSARIIRALEGPNRGGVARGALNFTWAYMPDRKVTLCYG
jgi:hypothetical protein